MIQLAANSLGFDTLQTRYLRGELRPTVLLEQLLAHIETVRRPEIWISRVAPDALRVQAERLEREREEYGARVLERLPLFGLPFAVKDNIDVAGMATTAACPGFSYEPGRSATVVEKLQRAGALLIGKTNLDQFATGLVGTRSPYGAVRNAIDPDYVSGGSSSGSAVAVALGLVSFALGTDTAGSGRVPAAFNDIVGLKPSRGLISTRGVVPACRTLDCVSVFALTVGDAWRVLGAAAGFDADDPYSRELSMPGPKLQGYRVAVPDAPEFFGDEQAQAAFSTALAYLARMTGMRIERISFAPFAQAAALLYQGPWVAERRAAIGKLFDEQPQAIDPTVHRVVAQADRYSALDTFNAFYRLATLRRKAEQLLADADFLLVPTAPTMPLQSAVEAEPVARNSELGYYTNFVNFFDMAALAIPAVRRPDGLPAGITLIGRCGADHLLAAAGEAIRAEFDLVEPEHARPRSSYQVLGEPLSTPEPRVRLAVVGAHLDGQPLNGQLLERGARKLCTTTTGAGYRLYALPETEPPKPGLARVADGGAAIEVEIWEMPLRHFGSFVAAIPAPLGIGNVQLADGSQVKGFICEPWALSGAHDITSFGGWRAYLANRTI